MHAHKHNTNIKSFAGILSPITHGVKRIKRKKMCLYMEQQKFHDIGTVTATVAYSQHTYTHMLTSSIYVITYMFKCSMVDEIQHVINIYVQYALPPLHSSAAGSQSLHSHCVDNNFN